MTAPISVRGGAVTHPNPDSCVRCYRPMVRGRHIRPAAGAVRHMARGYCLSCYQYLQRRIHVHHLACDRTHHRSRGPRADVDEVVVNRLIAGDKAIPYTDAEMRLAIEALDSKRLTARQVASRLGITMRTVQRNRAKRALGKTDAPNLVKES